ncbi:MAG: hypothetical protein HGGPFJEG_01449 [Ignavibacteria bacterium]|nr:hypothetical protein [Ignavibacteria bacterium]
MISEGDIWRDIYTGVKYKIINIEKYTIVTDERGLAGNIRNIKIQNITSGSVFDIGEWELKKSYIQIDSLHNAKIRG